MTDKKFTDEEIKSSLEVIATTRNCNECKIRNCKWGTCNCSQITANAALDLINRQEAEIERLEKKEIEIDDFCRRLCRMRMLNGDAIASYEDLQNYIQEAKFEAIKEFAERLRNKIKTECNPYGKPTFDYDTSLAIMHYIDNLVKKG